ncbi:hypothetical protein KX01_760 [Francisella frigiditurris]|uniref:Uncharacterized protein n=1 Tax=Francisella frigiditurris TaxID=1542390 RepID=A0A1J0KTM4_9GAMM|nr:hypothetical protein KX01_760 [Francisella frigiditurris]
MLKVWRTEDLEVKRLSDPQVDGKGFSYPTEASPSVTSRGGPS